jgi:hypothetical protein
MPLLRVQHYPGFKQVFIAAEAISRLAVIEVSLAGARYVKLGTDTTPERVIGVAIESVSSGQLLRAITHGVVSGLICGGTVNAGDRLGLASGGRVQALNTIPLSGYVAAPLLDLVSGGVASGSVTVGIGALACTSGFVSGLTGIRSPQFSSGLVQTGRMLGRALTSGGVGQGIQAMVSLE